MIPSLQIRNTHSRPANTRYHKHPLSSAKTLIHLPSPKIGDNPDNLQPGTNPIPPSGSIPYALKGYCIPQLP